MKFYEYFDTKWGKAFYRISEAIHKYSPDWVTWVNSAEQADVEIVHEVGSGEIKPIEDSISAGKKTIIVQHTYFTSGYNKWDELWERANLTISFHNLPDYTKKKFNFLASPWGYEPSVFYDKHFVKENAIFATGHVAETEHLYDVFLACNETNTIMYHTGEDFKWGGKYVHLPYMENDKFNNLLNRVKYVSCLRDIEGFEMAGVEGLACGATPIVLDLSTYRWYDGYSISIDPYSNIKDQLVNYLKINYILVNYQEKFEKTFQWYYIINNIFNKIKESI